MTIDILFWLIILIMVIFSVAWGYNGRPWAYGPFGGALILLVLICMLGWRVFGPALR